MEKEGPSSGTKLNITTIVWAAFTSTIVLLQVVLFIIGPEPALPPEAKIPAIFRMREQFRDQARRELEGGEPELAFPEVSPDEPPRQPHHLPLPGELPQPPSDVPTPWILGGIAIAIAFASPRVWRAMSSNILTKWLAERNAVEERLRNSAANNGGDLPGTKDLAARLLPAYLVHLSCNEAVAVFGFAMGMIQRLPEAMVPFTAIALVLQLLALGKVERVCRSVADE